MLKRLAELQKRLTGVRSQLCKLRAHRVGIEAVRTCQLIAMSRLVPLEKLLEGIVADFAEAAQAAEKHMEIARKRTEKAKKKQAAAHARNGRKRPKKKRRPKAAAAV